jgi:hypothetical protein
MRGGRYARHNVAMAAQREAPGWLEIRTLTPDTFEKGGGGVMARGTAGLSGPHSADLGSRVRAVDSRFRFRFRFRRSPSS